MLYVGLLKLTDMTKEEIDALIPYLCESHQLFLKEYFDEEYNRYNNVNWNISESRKYYSLIKRLRNLKNRNLNNGLKFRSGILELIKIEKDELDLIKTNLRQDLREFLDSHFDEEYNYTKSVDLWTDEERYFYMKTVTHLRKLLTPSKNGMYSPLTVKLGVSSEVLAHIIPRISSRSQMIIKKHYNSNYEPLVNVEWEPSDKEYFSKYTLLKIKEAIELASFNRKSVYYDLAGRLGITHCQLKYIISLLSNYRKEHIFKYYDKDFRLKEGIRLNEEDIYVIAHLILPALKELIKEFGLKEINGEYEIVDRENMMGSVYTETSKTVYDTQIKYHELYVESIKRNEFLSIKEKKAQLKALTDLYKEYTESNNLILTRKKD